MATISDLVADSRLVTQFFENHVSHEMIDSCVAPDERVRRQVRSEIWIRDRILRRGSYGTVWLEKCSSGSQRKLRATKALPKQSLSSNAVDYTRELAAMVKFSHRKYAGLFVTLLGWFEDFGSVYIATEYCELGDLEEHLSSPLPEVSAQQISKQILEGLEHLHGNGFTHSDLRPKNIFVVQATPTWWVKIGDFGVSRRVKDGQIGFSALTGTPGYLAPEVFGGISYTTQDTPIHMVDIWALGTMIHYMLTGNLPFKSLDDLLRYVRGGSFPADDLTRFEASLVSQQFISALMVIEPAGRSPAKVALQHIWMRNNPHAPCPVSNLEQNNVQETEDVALHTTGRGRNSDTVHAVDNIREIAQPPLESLTFSKQRSDLNAASDEVERRTTHHEVLPHLEPSFVDGSVTSISTTACVSSAEGLSDSGGLQDNLPQSDVAVNIISDYLHGFELLEGKQFAEAEEKFRASYANFRRLFGPSHERTLSCLYDIAVALYHQEHYAAAEKYYRQAYEQSKETLGAQHIITFTSAYKLGTYLVDRSQFEDAVPILRLAHAGFNGYFGFNHPTSLEILTSLGKCYGQLRDYRGETEHYQLAYEGYKEKYGPTKEITLTALRNIAVSLYNQGDYESAADYFRLAHHGMEEVMGPEILFCLQRLGESHYQLGNFNEAADAFEKTCETQKRLSGTLPNDIISATNWHALALYMAEKYLDAQRVLEKVCDVGSGGIVICNDPLALKTLNILKLCLARQGKPDIGSIVYKEFLRRP